MMTTGNPSPQAGERIVVRAPNWIGDAVMTTPAVAALRRARPEARIEIRCRPWVAPIYAHSPDVDGIVPFDEKNTRFGWWQSVRQIRQGRYDLGILFPNSLGTALALWAGGVGRRIGYDRDGRGWCLSDRVKATDAIRTAHMVDYYLNILSPLTDVSKAERRLRLFAGAEERAAVDRVFERLGIPAGARVAGVNPGAAFGTAKRWLPERYGETARRLVEEFDLWVVVTGSGGERDLAEQVAERGGERVLNLAGEVSLGEFLAVMERLALFVTNDSGAMHIAAGMDRPIVAIFGSTDWISTAPFSDQASIVRHPTPCAPCMKRDCPLDSHLCMEAVTVEAVMAAVRERLLTATDTTDSPHKSGPEECLRFGPAGTPSTSGGQ